MVMAEHVIAVYPVLHILKMVYVFLAVCVILMMYALAEESIMAHVQAALIMMSVTRMLILVIQEMDIVALALVLLMVQELLVKVVVEMKIVLLEIYVRAEHARRLLVKFVLAIVSVPQVIVEMIMMEMEMEMGHAKLVKVAGV